MDPDTSLQTSPQSIPTPVVAPGNSAVDVRALSRKFGPIPGVPIFTQWDKREGCAKAGVHRPPRAGIYGRRKYGAYSVVLSGSYEDDDDKGNVIIYTGSGGRQKKSVIGSQERPRGKRQTMDQSWDSSANGALKTSCSTGQPIRVIRSWKCPSKYAPSAGFRYDGLYIATECLTGVGKSGFKICRCRLERLPNQAPIPVRSLTVHHQRTSSSPLFTDSSDELDSEGSDA